MLSSKIENAHWAEKNDHNVLWHYRNSHNAKCGIRETATTRNSALWKLQWRQWGFRAESHLQPLNKKVT